MASGGIPVIQYPRQEGWQLERKLLDHWARLGIRARAIVTQIVMIVVPVFLCTVLIVNQITAENRNDTAVASYQYCRYIIQELDTNIRQIESMANTFAGNRYVREYVAMEPGEARDEFFEKNVYDLLLYAYNRYLPTHDIEILSNTTLDDIDTTGQITHLRSRYRLWSFNLVNRELPQCYFYYQFAGDGDRPAVLAFTPAPTIITETASYISSILKQNSAVYFNDGTLLYEPNTANTWQLELFQSLATAGVEGYTPLNDNQIGYCIRSETLPIMFVSFQQLSNVQITWNNLALIILLCLVLVIGSVTIVYFTFVKGIAARIVQLSHDCENMELNSIGKLSTPLAVRVRGNDEIASLSESINNMLRQITDLTRQNEQEVMVSQRAAYDMLAAQIHPHFIYNTLENLRMMAESNDDEQVADMLYVLGRMLRLSISDASSSGEVRTEMEHVQLYLQLQQMRMNGNLTYSIEPVPEEVASVRCPRFLLQPIAENAIKHGFQTRKTPGRIEISSGVTEKGVFLRVKDDGAGFTAQRLQEIREALSKSQPISHTRGGIGLLNVNTRLRMFYGSEAGLTLESTPEKGTVCTLWLAVNEQNQSAASSGDIPPESAPYTS
jgi:two-component system, sensor histidine kinase YesM